MKLQQTEVWLDNDLCAWVTLGTERKFKQNCQLKTPSLWLNTTKGPDTVYFTTDLSVSGLVVSLKLISHQIEDNSYFKLMSNVGNHADINRQYDGTHP